ncbi:alpha/beta hydrolase [Clostridium botulinum]|uniref:Hydrolase, alpha/beta fold family n=1 Tax=Clostridium botulinum (strain Okra / Type B1) TaxID=498213 RepID=B1IF18_CLOBK|nr:alpha/beta hydrolase [Clostridium botulinum]EKX80901.1 alpha/beta hydrolase [Clostridium botulinum CFSAN001628]ACA44254.1 hydrolase, alpha/beta fold family [Clostridium botulinum B1 str. Okra]MBD5562044.1 alpha/beta hydrolase [Clostridium botulinum]MBD5567913.1 alpha/beta hydrolase [Clostridium botulinum]MBD5570938.1 alpha/beta hydrolase [Clostridium botulinum]
MKSSCFSFKGREGTKINVYKWEPDNKQDIKAVIQISHGMAETANRYEGLASYLNEAGYIVYANDHRGHGKSALSLDQLGYLGEEDGFMSMVEDVHALNTIIKEENKGLPVFLLGHSMGSFISQRYIQLYGQELNGVILVGTNGNQGSLINMGILVAKLEMRFKGRRHKSNLLNNLSFGGYNKKFEPNRTEFDWLTRDEKEVDKYIKNEYCGTIFPASFYHDFLKGLKSIWKEENKNKIPINLPIFIIAGDKDPVGNFGKGILNLYNFYKSIGVVDVNYKLYKEGRHEILNEINKREVFQDVLNWIDSKYNKTIE